MAILPISMHNRWRQRLGWPLKGVRLDIDTPTASPLAKSAAGHNFTGRAVDFINSDSSSLGCNRMLRPAHLPIMPTGMRSRKGDHPVAGSQH